MQDAQQTIESLQAALVAQKRQSQTHLAAVYRRLVEERVAKEEVALLSTRRRSLTPDPRDVVTCWL